MPKSILAVSFTLPLLAALISCSASPQGAAGTGAVASPEVPENRSSETAALQTVKSVVLENERKIWDAFKARNANTVSALLADELQVVTVDGRFDKARFLDLVPRLPEIVSYTITNETVVSPSKDVAILTYDSTFASKEPQLVKHSAFQTTIWVNRGGKWVAVFNQETPQ